MKHKIGQTGKAYERNGDYWCSFEVTDVREEFDEDYFIVFKILDGEHKGKYSVVMKSELDSTIKFDTKEDIRLQRLQDLYSMPNATESEIGEIAYERGLNLYYYRKLGL